MKTQSTFNNMSACFLESPHPKLPYIIVIVPMTTPADVSNNVQPKWWRRWHQIVDEVDKQQLHRRPCAPLLGGASTHYSLGLLLISLGFFSLLLGSIHYSELLPIALGFLLISLGASSHLSWVLLITQGFYPLFTHASPHHSWVSTHFSEGFFPILLCSTHY